MEYYIYIGNKDKTKVYKLPIIPEKLPELSKPIANEEFETWWDGKYNFIEKPGLLEFTLECWLPGKGKRYNFAKSNVDSMDIISLLENARDNVEYINIIIIGSDGSIYVNDIFSIESFKYKVNWECDYDYSLSVKKYRESATTVKKDIKVGWNKDNTGWYYYIDTTGNYYKYSWQLIDNEWYYFDPQGYVRQSTWFRDGDSWYWLKDSCKMARNEWVQVQDKWYYLGSNGALYTDTYTPDGYYVNSDGVWAEG